MATRTAVHRIATVADFFLEYEPSIRQGIIALKPGEAPTELAPEIKLDLVLPLVGRVGPLPAQVLHRSPDGSAGLRIPEMPPQAQASLDSLVSFVDEVKAWLLATGALVDPATIPAARPDRRAGGSSGAQAPAERSSDNAGATAPRGFQVPDLTGVDPRSEGSLGDRSLRDCLVRVGLDRRQGLLVVVDGTNQQKLFGFFHRGGPVGWRSEPMDESNVLGVLLYRANKITREQLAESLAIMQRDGIRQGEAFMQMGIMSFPQLVMVLQKQVEVILQAVLRMQSGAWAFFELAELPERFVAPPLQVPALLFRNLKASTREMALETLAAFHRPNLDLYVFMVDGVEALLDEMHFSVPERKFVSIVNSNSWRLRELFSVTNLSRTETAATLWAFNEMSFVEYRSDETRDRYLARVSRRIELKAATLRAASHFEILEIHWICLPNEIDVGYKKLKAEFQPAQFKDLPETLLADMLKINAAIETSYQFLRNEPQRRAYREQLIEKGKIEQSADILAVKGEMAIMKQDRREATACWGKAVELMPRSEAFRAGLDRALKIG